VISEPEAGILNNQVVEAIRRKFPRDQWDLMDPLARQDQVRDFFETHKFSVRGVPLQDSFSTILQEEAEKFAGGQGQGNDAEFIRQALVNPEVITRAQERYNAARLAAQVTLEEIFGLGT
jgi:hypothetical protein